MGRKPGSTNKQRTPDVPAVREAAPQESAIVQHGSSSIGGEYSVQAVVDQVKAIKELMDQVLKVDQHYGTIPGTQKPTLYKPGAEKINYMFRNGTGDPVITETDLGNGHRNYSIKIPILHIPTNQVIGWGIGSCSTMESKYRYRNMSRKCPSCGKETIIKGRDEYGGGWVCYKKKGGCGAKFSDDNKSITEQTVGRVENTDIADMYNTCLKMASKRAYVEGTLKTTAASDFFTQDVEDFQNGGEVVDAEYTEHPSAPVADRPKGPRPDVVNPDGTGRAETEKDIGRLAAMLGGDQVEAARNQLAAWRADVGTKKINMLEYDFNITAFKKDLDAKVVDKGLF